MTIPFQLCEVQGLTILRDDLVAGGTKRRALDLLLKDMNASRVAYAGTVMGHGALALACACQAAGKEAVIFLSGGEDDPVIKRLRETNAVLHLCPPAPVAALYELAKEQAGDMPVLPPGFDTPAFEEAMVAALAPFSVNDYPELWTTAVTGTLTRALRRAFPDTPLKTVKVVRNSGPLPSDAVYDAPEKYHQAAKNPPPYPACPFTDAKLWQFAAAHAGSGALIWNTAG
ncbi:MAG TPA: hypothetical protein VFS88_06965 [Micavibrio sp.]|nr:hypothetical protein [Micavibrio sp.]